MTVTPETHVMATMPVFSGQPMHEYFCRMAELAPSSAMPASPSPTEWVEGERIELPSTYQFAGEEKPLEDFFRETDTAALLVLKDGKIRCERYALTGGRDVAWLSMSVAKSFVSTLVGIAVAEGHIRSLDDAISDYIPVEIGSAYDGVTIRDILMMSSGARWNEDYNDPEADFFGLVAATIGLGTLDEFVATRVRESEPGTVCRYNSTDTQALGTLLAHATGRSINDYMTEKLIEPLGMTAPSHWLVDSSGREMLYGGLTMTARDFARLGELYRNRGLWHGKQVVPAEYVDAATRSSAPHTQPGQPWVSHHQMEIGYGYQWWLPAGDPGEFSAIGIYNQFVYVHPSTGVVIVKLSANRAYGTSPDERTNREIETLAFLRHIARKVG
jgi:CubicO group peptidase (beta-lactamase class C family)